MLVLALIAASSFEDCLLSNPSPAPVSEHPASPGLLYLSLSMRHQLMWTSAAFVTKRMRDDTTADMYPVRLSCERELCKQCANRTFEIERNPQGTLKCRALNPASVLPPLDLNRELSRRYIANEDGCATTHSLTHNIDQLKSCLCILVLFR